MPQALALALFNAGAPLAVANAVVGVGIGGTILYTGGSIALAVGAAYLTSIAFRPPTQKPSDQQIEFQQPVPHRTFFYGEGKISGPVLFKETIEYSGAYHLYTIIALSSREIDSILEHWLDAILVTIDGGTGLVNNGQFQVSGDVYAALYPHLGADSQTADATLVAAFGSPIWTTDHRLRGIAYVVSDFGAAPDAERQFMLFPNGPPAYSAVIRGALLYDPRLDSSTPEGVGTHDPDDPTTWEWSDNPALVVLDYLRHADGYNRSIDSLDLESFQDMADICDEAVDLAASGTESRYRIALNVSLADKRSDVLKRMLEACDATLLPTAEGKWKIVGGAWVEPTVTLDASEGHIIDAEFTGGVSALERYNELAIQFMSPEHGYGEVEGEPWQDAADIAATGIVETRPFDVLQVPSHGQARRLAKIRMARDNPEWVGTIKTNAVGLNCIGERCVTIVWEELEIDGPFWIEECEVLGDGTGVTLRVRSASEESYDWDEDTEEGEPPPVPEEVE